MIQFNLLPDVKKEYVSAKRTKRLIITASFLSSAIAIAIVVVMFTFLQVAQKKNINDLTNDIQARTSEIESTENLNQILTVQNQLSLLEGLHEQKPETSRVFGYMEFVSPQELKIKSLNLDMENSTIKISGLADKLSTVDKFVKNLKTVQYRVVGDEGSSGFPYSEVNTSLSGTEEGANYDISFIFDPVIFDNKLAIIMFINDQNEVFQSDSTTDLSTPFESGGGSDAN